MKALMLSGALLIASVGVSAAQSYPVTIMNCDRAVSFDHAPTNTVTFDLNSLEFLLALDLKDRIAGYTGVSGLGGKVPPEVQAQIADLPDIAANRPSIEQLLEHDTDFYFYGWTPEAELSADALAKYEIPLLQFTEECREVSSERPKASMDDLFNDFTNLGRIYGVSERAEALISGYREDLASIAARESGEAPVRVFVYDAPGDSAFTCGRFCILTAMIEAAGGVNIFDDLIAGWDSVTWEAMIERDPQIIIIVDYGELSAQDKIDAILANPAFSDITAVTDKRFVVLDYGVVVPGPRAVEATKQLAVDFSPA